MKSAEFYRRYLTAEEKKEWQEAFKSMPEHMRIDIFKNLLDEGETIKTSDGIYQKINDIENIE